ncbi:MAG: hypothetical protein AAF317_14615 [Pseudomonadota bacterium]
MEIAASILDMVRIWGAIGAVVAVIFLGWGIDRIDEDARGAYVFRVLMIPGILIIWPLVLWRWWVLEAGHDRWQLRHRPPRRTHTIAAALMLSLIPAVIVAALALRQTWPSDYAPVRLDVGVSSGAGQ